MPISKGPSYSTCTPCVKIWLQSVKPFLSQGTHKHKKQMQPKTITSRNISRQQKYTRLYCIQWEDIGIQGEVVAQLVECSPINLLACASMGSNPITATLCPQARHLTPNACHGLKSSTDISQRYTYVGSTNIP